MLRALLIERFHLRVRREAREGNVYELVIASRLHLPTRSYTMLGTCPDSPLAHAMITTSGFTAMRQRPGTAVIPKISSTVIGGLSKCPCISPGSR